MTSGARMPHQGAPMGPPGPPYGGTPPIRPGMPNPVLDPNRKRPAPTQPVQPPPIQNRSRKWVFTDLSLILLILNQCTQQMINNRFVFPEPTVSWEKSGHLDFEVLHMTVFIFIKVLWSSFCSSQQLSSKLLPSIAPSSDWTILCLAGAGALSLDSNILIAKYFLVNIKRETVIITSNTLTAIAFCNRVSQCPSYRILEVRTLYFCRALLTCNGCAHFETACPWKFVTDIWFSELDFKTLVSSYWCSC